MSRRVGTNPPPHPLPQGGEAGGGWRWWHVCVAVGAGLSLLTAIGWAAERWGGGRSLEAANKSGARWAGRRGHAGGRGGRRSRGGKKGGGGRRRMSPETKVARVRQELAQVLSWMEKMERLVSDLPRIDDITVPSRGGGDGDDHRSGGGERAPSDERKEDADGVRGEETVRTLVRRTCTDRLEEHWRASGQTSDTRRQHVEAVLVSFAREGINRQRASFRRWQLSSFERYTIYETSERLGLTHRKEGDTIVISKLKFQIPPFDDDDEDQPGLRHNDATTPGAPRGAADSGPDQQDRQQGKEGAANEEEDDSAELDKRQRLNVERCKILEECLTLALLGLDSLVDCEEALPRSERKLMVHVCQQLLSVLDVWRAQLQHQEVSSP